MIIIGLSVCFKVATFLSIGLPTDRSIDRVFACAFQSLQSNYSIKIMKKKPLKVVMTGCVMNVYQVCRWRCYSCFQLITKRFMDGFVAAAAAAALLLLLLLFMMLPRANRVLHAYHSFSPRQIAQNMKFMFSMMSMNRVRS